jgi:hypothetical protein
MHETDANYTVMGVHAQLMFFHDGTGVAVESTYDRAEPTQWGSYVYRAKFYAFGCEHDYRGISADKYRELIGRPHQMVFRTEHAYQCTKCGHFYIVDSSD